MELSVTNDFISLFIPEQSEFTTDDLLSEFKIYIFRLMNITVDSLIQEQINNDFETSQLQLKYKDFFSTRIDSVLSTNTLYNEIKNKSNIIKNSLEKNIKIIEQNKSVFTENNINKDIEKCVNEIKANKLILKDNSLLNLLSIPYYMIDCFYHEEYELYLNYFNYINKIQYEHNVIKNIKSVCEFINEFLVKLINNLISIGYEKMNVKSDVLFDLLDMKLDNEIFNSNLNVNIDSQIKRLNCYLYQINLYMEYFKKNNNNNKLSYYQALNYIEEKISLITKENNKDIINKIIEKIYDKYIQNIIKNIFEINDIKNYVEIREKINSFIYKINISENSKSVQYELDYIMKKYFYKYLDSLISKNENHIKNYLLMTKDIKKFFGNTLSIQTTNNNSNNNLNNNIINNLKYELLFIIYNNLCNINNVVTSENFLRHKDIVITCSKLNEHCNKILDLIYNFFKDNLFIFRINKEYQNEFMIFKDKLMINVVKFFIKDIYHFFSIDEEFVDLDNEKKLDSLIQLNII